MIIDKNINPERDVYFLGAKAIDVISSSDSKVIDYFELFHNLNKTQKISINLYSLVLDWLFILGIIKKDNGVIEKCF
jgi:hypothetical protein